MSPNALSIQSTAFLLAHEAALRTSSGRQPFRSLGSLQFFRQCGLFPQQMLCAGLPLCLPVAVSFYPADLRFNGTSSERCMRPPSLTTCLPHMLPLDDNRLSASFIVPTVIVLLFMSSVGQEPLLFFLTFVLSPALATVISLVCHPPLLLGSPCAFLGSWLKNHFLRDCSPTSKPS